MSEDKITHFGEPMKTLKELHDAEVEANEAFVRASKNFTKPPFNAEVKYSGTVFKYATLSAIQDCVMAALLKEWLVPIHEFYNEGGVEWIKSYIRYKNGLTIGNVVLPVAIEGKTMQQIGAQITYLKRYSLSILCNISADADNDGTEMLGEKIIEQISPSEAMNVKDLLGNNKTAWEMLKKQYGYARISDITTNRYNEIVTALKLFNYKIELDIKKEEPNELL